ncbi:MAG TPA: C40 family peptidase [Gemmatimonadaceae bacterium]|nr:C40 family peptidase [Gemmatimonadaceae bacterium]
MRVHRTLSRVALIAALSVLPCSTTAQVDSSRSAWRLSIDSDSALPRPFESFNESARSLRDSIVALARAQVGKRYVYGGESPSRGFDCSGLVQYVAAALHIRLPRTARQQAHVGDAIPADTSRLLPGDLLTFGNGKTITHIGIYVGDGRMVHASTRAGKVIETKLLRSPARGIKPWRGARRLLGEGDGQKAESSKQKAVNGS